ncbi:MAG: VWA domain-containing protein, partial [bacterium]
MILPVIAYAGNVVYDPATGKFNIVVSVRWNATLAELDDICAEFQSASGILLDATDGAHQFGIVYIANNSTASNAADFWVVNAGGRSGAPTCNYGVSGQHIDMRRGVGPVPAARYDEVIVHEFAHYAYCVRDEYEGPATGGCGAANCNDNPVASCIGGANACLMEGPSDGNSEFCWSGNHDPDQDTEQHCDKCQSCWATMAGRPFGLVEPTSAPAAAAPAADNIACIFVDNVPRIVLVLDRSGSMASDSRLVEAQKAARLIVDLVEDGTFLGVTSFSTDAGPNPDYDLQTISTAGDRTDAKNAIDGLSPGGDTNYSAGLDLALQEFTRVGLAAANKSIVFLSDGENNTPGGVAAADIALWDKLDDLIDEDIVVNTLGVGPLLNVTDEDRLRRMADDTGGEYARTPVPTVSTVQNLAARSWSVDDYKPSLARFWASAEERAEVANSQGGLPPGTSRCDQVLVDSSMEQATFVTTWNGDVICSYPANPDEGLKVWLVKPDNSTIEPSMSGQPGIEFVQYCDAGYAFFKISAPALMEGEWQFCTSNEVSTSSANQTASVNGLEVFHQVFAKSALVWQTCNTLPARLIGQNEDVFVEASAFYGGSLSEVDETSGDAPQGPANTGEFTMTGHLLNTSGDEIYQFSLHDLGDAANGDRERADGIFSGRIPESVLAGLQSGTYKVIVDILNTGGAYFAGQHAKADPSDGEELTIPHFQRTASSSIVYDSAFIPPVNHPPVPDAGPDQRVECNGWPTSSVMLDATGSYDPDGDALTYNWWSPGITFDDPTSPTPTGQFPLGTTTVTLTVSDGEFTEGDAVDITVEDTTPPRILIDLNRDVLWPPNHKMADIWAR